MLNRTNRIGFFATFEQGLAVQYFYEPFLAAFDPELRKQLGVWYTPPEIVKGMVAKCDRLLREELGEPDGLAGDRVLLLDPCCGTGAFVVEALRVAAERWRDRGEPYADRLRHAATSRMFGFELLTGPFVVAHLQIAFLLAKHGVQLTGNERAAVYLTNALTGWEPVAAEKRALDPLSLYAESDRAHAVKRDEKIIVVVGNPPYGRYSGIALMEEERALSRRYWSRSAGGPGQNDLYARFFAMADRRIQETKRGLVCFITQYSWLDGLSYSRMRELLVESYDHIWIDNLNGDKFSTGKTTHEGDSDPSVFSTEFNREGIQPGTAVTTLLRNDTIHEKRSSIIHYRDFWGVNKRQNFQGNIGEYSILMPAKQLGLPFRPRDISAVYLSWPRLPEVIPVSFPGVSTARDSFLVDIDFSVLERRVLAYFDKRLPDSRIEEMIPGTMEPTKRYDSVGIRKYLQNRGIESNGFRRFAYRPFDVRWLYWERETKLLDEKRTEYVRHAVGDNVWLIAQQKTRREWSPPQLVRPLSCLDLIDRGASCFPLRLLPSKPVILSQGSLLDDGFESDSGLIVNLSPLARDVTTRCGLTDKEESVFFHSLSILHSPAYIRDNDGALKQDWPRIPLLLPDKVCAMEEASRPSREDGNLNRKWLLDGEVLGRRVAALLDVETSMIGVDMGDIEPTLRSIARYEMADGSVPRERTDDVALKARWGYRGQGGG